MSPGNPRSSNTSSLKDSSRGLPKGCSPRTRPFPTVASHTALNSKADAAVLNFDPLPPSQSSLPHSHQAHELPFPPSAPRTSPQAQAAPPHRPTAEVSAAAAVRSQARCEGGSEAAAAPGRREGAGPCNSSSRKGRVNGLKGTGGGAGGGAPTPGGVANSIVGSVLSSGVSLGMQLLDSLPDD